MTSDPAQRKARLEKSKLEEKIVLERQKTEEQSALAGQIIQLRTELDEIINKKYDVIKKLQIEQEEHQEKIKHQKQFDENKEPKTKDHFSKLSSSEVSENDEK